MVLSYQAEGLKLTLSSFKKHSKFTLAISFMVLYGLGFFLLGSTSIRQNVASLLNVRGAATKAGPTSPVDSPIPAADTQTNSIIASYVKLCSNATYGFSVSYPKDWFTTYNDDSQKCNYFAPYSFTVPADTDIQFTPIFLQVIKPEDWQGTLSYYQNPNDFQNVVSVQNIEVNGRSVQKVKALQTGKGSTTKGFSKVTFLISDSQNPIIIVYIQQDAKEDIAASEKALEDMARSLQYF